MINNQSSIQWEADENQWWDAVGVTIKNCKILSYNKKHKMFQIEVILQLKSKCKILKKYVWPWVVVCIHNINHNINKSWEENKLRNHLINDLLIHDINTATNLLDNLAIITNDSLNKLYYTYREDGYKHYFTSYPIKLIPFL